MRIIVTGLIAQYPLPGVTWDYLQFVLGLRNLGHDVYYIEDTGQWPYNPQEGGISKGCCYNVGYLAGVMNRFSLSDRWAYRFPWQSEWYGLPKSRRTEVFNTADMLINVSGTLANFEDYRQIPYLVYIDSDPVFTQVKLARGQEDFRRYVDAHNRLFSFGETLPGNAPDTGHKWRPTRQPIVLSEWEATVQQGKAYTTVMNWTSYNDVKHSGIVYGQKDVEFRRFLELPSLVAPVHLEIAVNQGKNRQAPLSLLKHKGWQMVDPENSLTDINSYRAYIGSSRGEWSVAKNGYVRGQAGWFSCRSACYLAASRPVILQETGFSNVLPVGLGLLSFTTLDEAVSAIEAVESDYELHCNAAREIAEEYFDSRKVLTRLLDDGFSSTAPGPSNDARTTRIL